MKKRTFLGLMAATPALALTGCGGGSGSGSAKVRLVNVNQNYASVDLWVDSTKKAAAVSLNTVSGYASVSSGSVDLLVKPTNSTTELVSKVPSLSKDKSYTFVLYGWSGDDAEVSSFIDNESTPSSGEASLAVLNASVETTSLLDVYITADTEDLASSASFMSSIPGTTRKTPKTLTAGQYRLRVTGAGNTDDLRLDMPLTVASKGIYTLILAPGSSGVLINAYLLAQGGAMTPLLNTKARVRVIPALANNATVSVTLGTQAVMSNFKSPWIGEYTLVEAGNVSLQTSVAGTALASATLALDVGTDVTLLVTGNDASDAKVVKLEDDNRLPTTSGKFKLRLLHAAPSLAGDNISMTLGSNSSLSVAYAQVSKYTTFTSGNDQSVLVETQSMVDYIYNADTDDFASKGVYTALVWEKGTALQVKFHADR